MNEEGPTVPVRKEEGSLLAFLIATGILFNALIILNILLRKRLRKVTTAFILHACVLDLLKGIYYIPYASSYLTGKPPEHCQFMAGSFIVLITATNLNLIAMTSCEVYFFTEDSSATEMQGCAPRLKSSDQGSTCCVAISLFLVYCGAIIIHLGPTIIAGNFGYNEHVGNCIFKYGTVTSYVAHIVWFSVTTLTMLIDLYLIWLLRKQTLAKKSEHYMNLNRHLCDQIEADVRKRRISSIKHFQFNIMSRMRVLLAVSVTFIVCWLPLFLLVLADPGYNAPKGWYRAFTILAWSNASMNPAIFIVFDRNFDIIRKFLLCSICRKAGNRKRDDVYMEIPLEGGRQRMVSEHRSNVFEMQSRIGGRLHDQWSDDPWQTYADIEEYRQGGIGMVNCNGAVTTL